MHLFYLILEVWVTFIHLLFLQATYSVISLYLWIASHYTYYIFICQITCEIKLNWNMCLSWWKGRSCKNQPILIPVLNVFPLFFNNLEMLIDRIILLALYLTIFNLHELRWSRSPINLLQHSFSLLHIQIHSYSFTCVLIQTPGGFSLLINIREHFDLTWIDFVF